MASCASVLATRGGARPAMLARCCTEHWTGMQAAGQQPNCQLNDCFVLMAIDTAQAVGHGNIACMKPCVSLHRKLPSSSHSVARHACCIQPVCLATRYKSLIYDTPSHLPRARGTQPRPAAAHEDVRTVTVHVRGGGEQLSLDTDESYTLTVSTALHSSIVFYVSSGSWLN